MPAKSRAQQRAAGADRARCRADEAPKTMPCDVAAKFARAPAGLQSLPPRTVRPHGSAPFSDAELRQGYRRLA